MTDTNKGSHRFPLTLQGILLTSTGLLLIVSLVLLIGFPQWAIYGKVGAVLTVVAGILFTLSYAGRES